MPHAQRIGLINFYYSLLSLPAGRNPVPLSTDPITEASTVAGPEICEFTSRLDPNVLDTVLSMLARLLRKGKRLKDAAENGEIPSPALSLDWKVLWRLWRTLVHFKSRDKSPPAESKPLSNLLGVIELARPFFTDPLRARKEMLDELLPLFDSEFGVSSGLAWNALGALLPSEYPPSSSSSDEFDHIPLLLATYLSAGASPLPPASILTLLSRTARDNIASPIRPGFTSSQIRAVVANALGMGGVVEIPGAGRRGIGSVLQAMGLSSLSGPLSEALGKLKGDSVRHLAGFLVWTCFPPPFSSSDDDRVPQTGVPELIEDIMSALDTYFHPSNTGKWTSGLVRFARELIDGFLERFREGAFFSVGCESSRGWG